MSHQLEDHNGIRLAIEGCGHGTLHTIYASITEACKQKHWPGVDLLIIGGDFQSVRNAFDLNCVSMPAKYREMCDFHEYYSGQRTAPYLTIFVGGNHEASNYLFELYYGGWVAPNIYYMGAANVLRLGDLRIAGLSGIWKGFDYRKPHFERLPYNESDMRSVYHVREMDVRKLLQVRTQVDVGVSHDWPQGVEWRGNWKQLFRFKKHFEEDARSGRLGSVAAKQVLERLRPRYWFSAHLHCKYVAKLAHEGAQGGQKEMPAVHGAADGSSNADEIDLDDDVDGDAMKEPPKNTDEIDLDMDDDEDIALPSEAKQELTTTPAVAVTTAPTNAEEIDLELDRDDAPSTVQQTNGASSSKCAAPEASPALEDARAALPASFAPRKAPELVEHPPAITNSETSFLALDKCLPNRHFLQLLSIPTEWDVDSRRPLKLEYDREWLAITRAFALSEPTAFGDTDARAPQAKSQAEYRDLIEGQRKWADENIKDSDLVIPENFEVLAPVYDGGNFQHPQYQQVREYPNPQTAHFCQMLQIPNTHEISDEEINERLAAGPRPEPEMHMQGGFNARGGFVRGRGRDGRGGRGGRRRGGGGRGRGRGRGG